MRTENKTKDVFNKIKDIFLTVIAAILSAIALHVFVYKNSFAPSGIDGIATMIQELTNINAGIISVVLNAPLLIVAWFFLHKKYVLYTILFTFLSSAFVYLLSAINFYQFIVETDKIIVAAFSGIMLGIRTGIMLKIGASSGGVDVIACIIKERVRGINIEKIISGICYAIICASYFVYGDLLCVLLSVVQTETQLNLKS